MIVKDEAHVIERSLSAVRPFIDHWLIVDTGSTDGTQDLVRQLMAGIPGMLEERPWQDFAHNRTQALELARGHAEYSLLLDADDTFTPPADFAWPELTADAYSLMHALGSTAYWRGALVANRLPWRYVGVLHEYLECEGVDTPTQLVGPTVVCNTDGGRSQGITTAEKYARDAETLEAALVKEPKNARYQFYLARSYRDSEQWDRALEAFTKRVPMGGFAEEVYDSLHAIAGLHEIIGSGPDTIIAAYLAAHENRPTRAEPLCSLARYLREQDRFQLAAMFAERAMQIPRPDDILFVDEDVYRWRSQDELAVASYWTGDFERSASLSRALLVGDGLPETQRSRVQENLEFAETKLRETGPA